MKVYQPQTMSMTFCEICEGRAPWIALGNFLNDWFANAVNRRADLVAEALPEASSDAHCQRWAAYCAATVEYLCHKYGAPCPEWVYDARYVLKDAWYCHEEPHRREDLITSTPIEFRKRNIYSGSSEQMFGNKWEMAEKYRLPYREPAIEERLNRPIEELLLEREKIRAQARQSRQRSRV
jgi:hypothetical protein